MGQGLVSAATPTPALRVVGGALGASAWCFKTLLDPRVYMSDRTDPPAMTSFDAGHPPSPTHHTTTGLEQQPGDAESIRESRPRPSYGLVAQGSAAEHRRPRNLRARYFFLIVRLAEMRSVPKPPFTSQASPSGSANTEQPGGELSRVSMTLQSSGTGTYSRAELCTSAQEGADFTEAVNFPYVTSHGK